MKITKYGHSCLFIEEGDAKILIDPGKFCFDGMPLKPEDIPACNVLLLTHEHADHTYPEALKIILKKSQPVILTNASVQRVLQENGIESELLQRGEERTVEGASIRGVAFDHGIILGTTPPVENIGFVIAGRLLHPGDCVHPSEDVQAEILAVPIAAPWMAVKEGVAFVKQINPKYIIPIHDEVVKHYEVPWYKTFEMGLQGTGIEFVRMPIGEVKEF